MKKLHAPDIGPPAGLTPGKAPAGPAPAATDGTFYGMLDMLQRQAPDDAARPDGKGRR